MVITDLAVVDYLFRMNHHFSGISKFCSHLSCQVRNHAFHIFCEKTAVCSRIGYQLLLIKALGIIKCLLCRKSQKTVGIPLQRCKTIKLWRLLLFICRINLCHLCGLLLPSRYPSSLLSAPITFAMDCSTEGFSAITNFIFFSLKFCFLLSFFICFLIA